MGHRYQSNFAREEMSKNNAAASVFDKFVEVGRLVYINQGKFQGKVAVIIDIVDANRVLVNGPTTDVPRHVINLKRVNLTDYRMRNFLALADPRPSRSSFKNPKFLRNGRNLTGTRNLKPEKPELPPLILTDLRSTLPARKEVNSSVKRSLLLLNKYLRY